MITKANKFGALRVDARWKGWGFSKGLPKGKPKGMDDDISMGEEERKVLNLKSRVSPCLGELNEEDKRRSLRGSSPHSRGQR